LKKKAEQGEALGINAEAQETGTGANMKLRSEFIRYNETKFKEIMEMDNITPADVMKSLDLEKNVA